MFFSLHIRLLSCLEQYQTAQQAHEFMVEYFSALFVKGINSLDVIYHISIHKPLLPLCVDEEGLLLFAFGEASQPVETIGGRTRKRRQRKNSITVERMVMKVVLFFIF